MPWQGSFRPETADEHGLVAVGGDLRPESLLAAYRGGVFPWYGADLPICWWSPDPRAILPLDGFRVGRRLRRTLRSGRFETTANRDFAGVVRGCADREETWLVPEMIDAYLELHRLGHAHSVEAWRDGELAGGVYGVAVGGLFAGESMFRRAADASKVALAALVDRLNERGFRLFDIQMLTPHTAGLGGREIPRGEYLVQLAAALAAPAQFA